MNFGCCDTPRAGDACRCFFYREPINPRSKFHLFSVPRGMRFSKASQILAFNRFKTSLCSGRGRGTFVGSRLLIERGRVKNSIWEWPGSETLYKAKSMVVGSDFGPKTRSGSRPINDPGDPAQVRWAPAARPVQQPEVGGGPVQDNLALGGLRNGKKKSREKISIWNFTTGGSCSAGEDGQKLSAGFVRKNKRGAECRNSLLKKKNAFPSSTANIPAGERGTT